MTAIETTVDLGDVLLEAGSYNDEQLTFAGAGTLFAGTILARDSSTLKMVPYMKFGAGPGHNVPKTVLTYDVIATGAGDVLIRALIGGVVRRERLIEVAGQVIDAQVLEQLRDYGDVSVDVQELNVVDVPSFISTWKTDNVGVSGDDQVKLPLEFDGTYNFRVKNWGDGVSDVITAWDQAEATHTYAVPGTYTIEIEGVIDGFRLDAFFGPPADPEKIIEISNWGTLKLGNNTGYFLGCINLVITATDILDLTGTTDMTFAFGFCPLIATIPGITSWDWSNVTTLEFTFGAMALFDQNLSGMDVSNVINFSAVFNGCALFNSALIWDTSSGENFDGTFSTALAFNHPSVIDWDMSSALTIESMFFGTLAFDQPIGVWDVSSVINFESVFAIIGAGTPIFNQNINAWDVSSGETFGNMFSENKVYNQPVNNWTPSSAIFMNEMFRSCIKFNQPVSNLVGSTVTDINDITSNASDFNQDVSAWDVSNVTVISQLGDNTSMSTTNYDLLLNAWSLLTVQPGITLDMGSINFTTAVSGAARTILAGAPNNWTFVDGGGI